MKEYNIETISRILETEDFEIDKLDLNKIRHVPMHQYRISTLEKPLLLIENLQVCIGLFAYSKDFGFAAHINPVVMRNDEFEYDENKNIVHCNRIDDLFNAIVNAKIKDYVYIGISIGHSPSKETYKQIDILNKSIDILVSKLNIIGIVATKLEIQKNHVFILDPSNENIITPLIENIKEQHKFKK